MPKMIDEAPEEIIESPLLEQPLGLEYEEGDLPQVAQTDFGNVPMESKTWMRSLKRMRNIIEDAKNGIQRMRREQADLPTATDLVVSPRKSLESSVYNMERRWLRSNNVVENLDGTLESLRLEADALDREMRTITTNSRGK